MAWGDDVALYNTAVTDLHKFVVSRDGNTPATDMLKYKLAAQASLDAIATPASATFTMPKTYPAL